MKKTLIIVAVIAVVAVVAFLLFRKKDDGADGKTMGLGNPNADKTPLSGEEVVQIGSDLVKASELPTAVDIMGERAEITESVDYLLGLTAGQKADYKKYVERYKNVIGKDLTGLSYDVVVEKYDELGEMLKLQEALKNELGITIDLSDSKFNELKEVEEYYDIKDVYFKQQAESLAKGFIEQFNVSQAFNREKKKNYHKLNSYQGWNTTVMEGLKSLPKRYAIIADSYVKEHWDGKYKLAPKKNKWGTAESDAETVNMSGKSIIQALQANSFMLNGRNSKSNNIANDVIEQYRIYALS